MTSRPFPAPLRPDFSAVRGKAGDLFVKAACCHLLAAHSNDFPERVAASYYAKDLAVAEVTRAAIVPADSVTSGWASTFSQTSISDFMLAIGPQSAGSALLKRGISLEFANNAAIKVPSITSSAAVAAFVQEGSPAPVQQLSFASGVTLAPRKFLALAVFSREIFQHSTPSIETIVRAVLAESVGLALDTAMFSSTAGDATRPAGLLVGLSAITPAASGDWAMVTDIESLAGAVAPVAANSPLTFIASPKQAARMAYSTQLRGPFEVFSSSALADKTVMCVASNCLVSAISPAPRFELSTEATIVLDTAPAALGTVGTPNVVGAPARSLFQTDMISLRMSFEMSWALRSSTGLQFMSAVNW
jgi:hypothetical protein